jgi:hypothetical protein
MRGAEYSPASSFAKFAVPAVTNVPGGVSPSMVCVDVNVDRGSLALLARPAVHVVLVALERDAVNDAGHRTRWRIPACRPRKVRTVDLGRSKRNREGVHPRRTARSTNLFLECLNVTARAQDFIGGYRFEVL